MDQSVKSEWVSVTAPVFPATDETAPETDSNAVSIADEANARSPCGSIAITWAATAPLAAPAASKSPAAWLAAVPNSVRWTSAANSVALKFSSTGIPASQLLANAEMVKTSPERPVQVTVSWEASVPIRNMKA